MKQYRDLNTLTIMGTIFMGIILLTFVLGIMQHFMAPELSVPGPSGVSPVILVDNPAPLASVTRGDETPRSPAEQLAVLCQQHGVNLALAEAIIWTESRWVPDAININTDGTIDAGRFQLNSGSWGDISQKIGRSDWDPFTPLDNMQAGVAYLAYWTRYWSERGYTGPILTSMVISSFAAPSATEYGDVQWWYINRIRTYLGWEI